MRARVSQDDRINTQKQGKTKRAGEVKSESLAAIAAADRSPSSSSCDS